MPLEETVCDLRTKEVINVSNGKSLGFIIDLVFDVKTAKILGFIVPNKNGIFNIFSKNNETFIPYQCICKIGVNVVLVNFENSNSCGNKLSYN